MAHSAFNIFSTFFLTSLKREHGVPSGRTATVLYRFVSYSLKKKISNNISEINGNRIISYLPVFFDKLKENKKIKVLFYMNSEKASVDQNRDKIHIM